MKHSSKSSSSKYRSKANSRDRIKHKRNIQRNRSEHQSKDTLGEFLSFWQIEKLPSGQKLPDSSARPISQARSRLLGAILTCCFLILIFRSAFIMLAPDKKLENQAMIQFEKTELLEGRRGLIMDRNQEIYATTVFLWNLALDPHLVRSQDIDSVVTIIDKYTNIDAERLRNRLVLAKSKNKRWLMVNQAGSFSNLRLDPADVENIQKEIRRVYLEHREKDDVGFYKTSRAFYYPKKPYRFYPNRDEAAPLIGIVQRSGTGASGLEYTYNSTLGGEAISITSRRDKKNNTLSENVVIKQPEARDGDNLVLTIDRNIQHLTDMVMKETLVETGAEGAWAMVMDVRTGELLAVSSQPTTNINDLKDIKMSELHNRALSSVYEPGSVMKPLVAAIGIEEGSYTADTLIDCEGGSWYQAGKRIRDDHAQKILSLAGVIQHSSNIGIAKVALDLGAKRVLSKLLDLGFGVRPPMDFFNMPRGLLRNPATIKPIELITTSYGYGMNATMLQILSSYATLGNGGIRMQPRIIKEILNPRMIPVTEYPAEEIERVFSEETSRSVVKMMEKVVREGTGKNAIISGYRTAGKTGTAKKYVKGSYSPTDRIGSFFGLVPADNPILAIGVTVDTPTLKHGYGGVVAAPAFAEIASGSMRYLGIKPDPDLLTNKGQKGSLAKKQKKNLSQKDSLDSLDSQTPKEITWQDEEHLTIPNLVGLSLRDALALLSSAHIHVSFSGSGRITSQTPSAGAPIALGEKLELILQ